MSNFNKRMEDVTKGIQPLVSSKNSSGPSYMFSQSGKSFNKNFSVFDGKKDRTKLKSPDENNTDEEKSQIESKNVDQQFFAAYNQKQEAARKEKKLQNKKRRFYEVEKNTKKKLEEVLGDQIENTLNDDDRFLFYMESDLDKIRGTRDLSYLKNSITSPPVGAYSPKYNLSYKRVKNVPKYYPQSNFASQSMLGIEPIKKRSNRNNTFDRKINLSDTNFSKMLAEDNDADILDLKRSGSFFNKIENLDQFLCPKDNCYSNHVAKMPALMRNTQSNLSMLKSRTSVDMSKQVERQQDPIDRNNNVNVFSNSLNYSNPQPELNINLPPEKNRLVPFEQNMGREKDFRKSDPQAVNLDYEKKYQLCEKAEKNYTIPKARRQMSMYWFIKEDELNQKKNVFDTNNFSISSNQFANCKKIPDFSKMGDRNRPACFIPSNLSQLDKDKRRKRVNYKRKYHSHFVEIEKLLDEINHVNDT